MMMHGTNEKNNTPGNAQPCLTFVNRVLDGGCTFEPTSESMNRLLPKFWIDALCINQRDLAEREEQVGRMGSIYKSASSLYVWAWTTKLDPAKLPNIDLAIFSIKTLLKQHLSSSMTGATRDLLGSIKDFLADAAGAHTEAHTMIVLSLSTLFNLPWFSRAWIFQEVALTTSLTA